MDDWIRLFNTITEELKMLEASTKNAGILEMIKEVGVMSLRKHLRLLHEARQKEICDRAAREDYVRSEGFKEGCSEGLREGLRDLSRIRSIVSSTIRNMESNDFSGIILHKETSGAAINFRCI